jgi:hypothetical protein
VSARKWVYFAVEFKKLFQRMHRTWHWPLACQDNVFFINRLSEQGLADQVAEPDMKSLPELIQKGGEYRL